MFEFVAIKHFLTIGTESTDYNKILTVAAISQATDGASIHFFHFYNLQLLEIKDKYAQRDFSEFSIK